MRIATGIFIFNSSAICSRSFNSNKLSTCILAPSSTAIFKSSYGLYGPLKIISLPSTPSALAFWYSNSLTTSALDPSLW
jgi:hypothetical protein